jgi:hypothetical protein
MSEEVSIKIKRPSSTTTIDLTVLKSLTVLELKAILKEKTGLEESRQNIVYKGKILADEKLLSDYGVSDDHTMILVEKVTNNSTTTTPTPQNRFPMQTGLGTPGIINTDLLNQPLNPGNVDIGALSQMLGNPEVQQQMNDVK